MAEQETITLYGHPACPMMPPVLGTLKSADVPYDYINIHQDDEAAQRVREINDGYESVPTLVFPDGSTLTEPSPKQLRQSLEAHGYPLPLMARVIAYLPMIAMGLVILYAVLSFLEVI